MPKLEPKNAEQRAWLKGRSKFCTGFCNDINKPAQCEGTKPKSYKGEPMPTCPFWLTCPCECHWNVDQLFKITGMERQLVPNPEYRTPESEFVIPETVIDPLGTVASSGDGVIGPDDDERPVAATWTPPAAPLAERRTETGRAARGGLEAQVWEACRTLDAEPLTPKVIGEWLADKYHIPTPSSGAINAVWDRWDKLGFAKQGKKPNRFLGFTGEGTWEELARLKAKVKGEKRRSASELKRGIRRA